MALTDEEKSYIKEIVREAYDERLNAVERKVFNGFGSSITWLWRIMSIMFAGILGIAFWKIRS